MPNERDPADAKPVQPPAPLQASIPPGFSPTVVRAEQAQQAKGLGIQASIVPAELDQHDIVVEPAETAHIPIEELSRSGHRVVINEGGELEDGPAIDQAAYEIESVLGRGGMGVVCLARQKSLNRDVALKIARKSAGTSEGTTRAALEMFTNEAYTTANLDHPNVVPVHTLARDADGRLFFTMQRVSGLCWEHLLSPGLVRNRAERAKVEERAASMQLTDHLEILNKVADALAYAHAKGVLHRDVKPENVMIGAYGEVLLMDWGLAMPFGDRNPYLLDPELVPQLVGTPAYLAPEMARGEMTDFGPATDVYLLGATLYRVLTGQPPHWGEGIVGAVNKAASGKIDPPDQVARKKKPDPEISRICLKALAAKQADRYPSVKGFQVDLREYLAHAEALTISQDAARMLTALQEQLVVGGSAKGAEDDLHLKSVDKDDAALAYGRLSECIGAYRQSIALWSCNDQALRGLLAALTLQVELAFVQGDLTLAKTHIELMDAVCGPDVDEGWARQVRKRQQRLSTELAGLLAHQAKAARRDRLLRRLVLAIILLLAGSAVGAFYLIIEQRSLALDNLRITERKNQLAREALRTSDQLHKRIFARSVAGQAKLVAGYLQGIEQVVSLYSQEATRLASLPGDLLPPRRRSPAGRDGYYLDEDFYAATTRPTDMYTDARYRQPVSRHHPTVKLAPWAMTGAARGEALASVTRLSRLGRQFSQVHQARSDILYSVTGTKTGALISYPGSGRYRAKPEYDPTKRTWYAGAIEATEPGPRWVDPHVDAGGLGLLITCVSPIRLGDHNIGVVGAEYSMQTLQRMVVEFTRDAGADARGLLIRSDGKVVVDTRYAADPSRWKERFEMTSVEDLPAELASYYRGARQGQVTSSEALEVDTASGPRLFSHAKLGNPDWMLVVTIARSAVLTTSR